MAYGIGRVPGDVDPTAEAMADLEAQKIVAGMLRSPRARRTTAKCRICGAPATMNASLGPACDEHYDDLAD